MFYAAGSGGHYISPGCEFGSCEGKEPNLSVINSFTVTNIYIAI